jgi:hypothetical protein
VYDPEYNLVPTSKRHLWEMLEQHFNFIEEILWNTPVESREDALTQRLRKGPNGIDNSPMYLIKYQDVHKDYDNRDHFLKMGRELLPYIRQALDERKITPEFVQKWGMIMYCHGYIANIYFNDADDLAQKRAGWKTKVATSLEPQRKWIAHLFLGRFALRLTHNQACEQILEHVHKIISRLQSDPCFAATPYGKFDVAWYQKTLGSEGLSTAYERKRFSRPKMRELQELNHIRIPPTDMPLP